MPVLPGLVVYVQWGSTPSRRRDGRILPVRRAGQYQGDEVIRQESQRAEDRRRQSARYQALFVDGPTLTVPVAGRINYSFDPRHVVSFDEHGVVYPIARITDVWGVLEVEQLDGGAQMLTDAEGATQGFVVAAPEDARARPLNGSGWKLELAKGWTLKPGRRPGDYLVAPAGD